MILTINAKIMDIDHRVTAVIGIIEDLGYEVLIVGGFVRDYFLGHKSSDYDLATNADLVSLKDHFTIDYEHIVDNKTIMLSLNYEGLKLEISAYRIETYDDNQNLKIDLVDSYELDSKRRDFTMNAIAYNREFRDFNNGIQDIEARIIRVIGQPLERFKQDPLRMLRALRFASENNLKLDQAIIDTINQHYDLLAKHDLAEELYRTIMGANFAYVLDCLEVYFTYLTDDFMSPLLDNDRLKIKSRLDLTYYLIFKQNLRVEYILIQALGLKKTQLDFISKYSPVINELKYEVYYEDIELMFATFGSSVMLKIYANVKDLEIINANNLDFIKKVSEVGYLRIDQLKVSVNDLSKDYSVKSKYEILKNLQKLIIKGFLKNDYLSLLKYIESNY